MIIRTSPLIDIHVHFRQPGGEHKETIITGANAAYKGGFGAVACMPNTLPPIDSPELVRFIIKLAEEAKVKVYPIAAITKGQKGETLADFEALKKAGAVAVSDDGLPVTNDDVMRKALIEGKRVGLPVISHCEPETQMAARDIRLAEELDCPVHIAHVSLKSTVDEIRAAKARGVKVTAETCPHYLVPWASGKMNPPLAGEKDIQACIDGLTDGTIDCITTDHAPHTAEEKAGETPPNGVIGLETSLSVVLMTLYHTNLMSIDDILLKMRDNPAKILGIPLPVGVIEINTDKLWVADNFVSKSANSAFFGKTLKGTAVYVD